MRRFVLTGGHGVGKSSIIFALEQVGEHVVFEAASAVRAVERARGQAFPEDHAKFESKALALQLRREAQVPSKAARVFLDRGVPDHLAYAQVGHWSLTSAEVDACARSRYELAFLVEPPAGGVPTLDRVEAEFCRRLVNMIEKAYQEVGVPLVRVPYGPIDVRVRFILDTVEAAPGYADHALEASTIEPTQM